MATAPKSKVRLPQIVIQDAKLLFRNFAGAARPPYNQAGDRNCNVLVPPELAAQLKADGWNVRTLKATDETVEPGQTIAFTINMQSQFPPRIWLCTPGHKPELMEADDLQILDYAKFTSVSLKINPWIWQASPQRVSGFLEEGFFELEPDPLRDRYFANNDNA